MNEKSGIASSTGAGLVRRLGAAVEGVRSRRGRATQIDRVFERCLMPMVTVDNERRNVAVNPAARLLARRSLSELGGRRIDEFTPPSMMGTLHQVWSTLMADGSVAGNFELAFTDGGELSIVYCALANILPGQHLIVFAPADWPEDELGVIERKIEPLRGPLSPREREVLSLIAAGADFNKIAEELTISPATVRTHAQNAMRKLGAHNRAHAIALATRDGLIDLPPLVHMTTRSSSI